VWVGVLPQVQEAFPEVKDSFKMHLKRISFFLFLCSISLSSQTLNDVLGFTSNNPSGTARFESMGGAFGALGGDLSAININPASSAVFNDNEYGFTLSIEKKN